MALLFLYACVGIPEWLAKSTPLGMGLPKRTRLGIGLASTTLIVRYVT